MLSAHYGHFGQASMRGGPELTPNAATAVWKLYLQIGWFRSTINSSPPGQNGRHFADDLFVGIFVYEKFCILVKISLKFVPKGLINNNLALL